MYLQPVIIRLWIFYLEQGLCTMLILAKEKLDMQEAWPDDHIVSAALDCTPKPGSARPHSSNYTFEWRRKSQLFLRAVLQKISFGYNCKSKWRPLVLQCRVVLHGNLEPGYRMTKWLLRSEKNRWSQAVSNEWEERIHPHALSDAGDIYAWKSRNMITSGHPMRQPVAREGVPGHEVNRSECLVQKCTVRMHTPVYEVRKKIPLSWFPC